VTPDLSCSCMEAIASGHDSCAEPFRQAHGHCCSNLERACNTSLGNCTRSWLEAVHVQSLADTGIVVVVVAEVAEVVDMPTASASSHTG
jgi:hypothetical protein